MVIWFHIMRQMQSHTSFYLVAMLWLTCSDTHSLQYKMTAFQLFLVQKCEICVFFWSQHLRRLSPYFIPKILINMASGHVSMRYGFQVNFLITIWHSYGYCQMNVNRNSYASNLGSKPCCCDSLCDRCSLYWWCYTDDSIWRCRCDGGWWNRVQYRCFVYSWIF